jgi:hypothetical protein
MFHGDPDSSCPHCRAAHRSAKVRRLWDCQSEFVSLGEAFSVAGGILKPSEKARPGVKNCRDREANPNRIRLPVVTG